MPKERNCLLVFGSLFIEIEAKLTKISCFKPKSEIFVSICDLMGFSNKVRIITLQIKIEKSDRLSLLVSGEPIESFQLRFFSLLINHLNLINQGRYADGIGISPALPN